MAKEKSASKKTKGLPIGPAKDLTDFLQRPVDTTSREALLTRRFLYDMSLSAAHAGYALQIFTPDVDREGVDVVLSDADMVKPLQLKSTVVPLFKSPKKTIPTITGVHGGLLKPDLNIAEQIGFAPTVSGTGQGGAVVLIEIIKVDQSALRIDVRYWISDAYILAALANGLVPSAPQAASAAATKLCNALCNGTTHDRVSIPPNCFVPAASAAALLTLAGLHSHGQSQTHHTWQVNLCETLRHHSAEENRQLGAVPPNTPEMARKKLDEVHAEKVREAFAACVASSFFKSPPPIEAFPVETIEYVR